MLKRRLIQNEMPMLVTTNVKGRREIFVRDGYAREAIDHLYRIQVFHPFFLYAFVIMPDHCHFLLRVCEPEKISRVMNVYKSGLAHQIGAGPIWQPRYHLEIVRNLGQVISYIHLNPVEAGIVHHASDYPWSSASGKWDVTQLSFL